jgi:hypothetical protein
MIVVVVAAIANVEKKAIRIKPTYEARQHTTFDATVGRTYVGFGTICFRNVFRFQKSLHVIDVEVGLGVNEGNDNDVRSHISCKFVGPTL